MLVICFNQANVFKISRVYYLSFYLRKSIVYRTRRGGVAQVVQPQRQLSVAVSSAFMQN